MRIILATLVVAALVAMSSLALAHTPLFACYDNGDDTVTCEGGFSDGSSAAGVAVHIFDADGNVLQDTALDEFSEITFDKPEGSYSVQFDAGEGHQIDVSGDDIVE
ncbi:MAG: hypothetical protein D6E12_15845 [Desulfovibrio sp.]|nr:MAG: hypothetical protein D6E12_15845 [Desulfovibrio sp.]